MIRVPEHETFLVAIEHFSDLEGFHRGFAAPFPRGRDPVADPEVLLPLGDDEKTGSHDTILSVRRGGFQVKDRAGRTSPE